MKPQANESLAAMKKMVSVGYDDLNQIVALCDSRANQIKNLEIELDSQKKTSKIWQDRCETQRTSLEEKVAMLQRLLDCKIREHDANEKRRHFLEEYNAGLKADELKLSQEVRKLREIATEKFELERALASARQEIEELRAEKAVMSRLEHALID